MKKKCYILAGPNGAGKTTFAGEFLPIEAECLNFINADLIAHGLSPFQPEKAAIKAGRLMIEHIAECVKKNESFAFETTLSGKGYIKKITDWKKEGYEIVIYFLRLPSVEFAIERVKFRVAQGGHNVPEQDIRRRFERGWVNFNLFYTSNWRIHGLSVIHQAGRRLFWMNRGEDMKKHNKYAVIGLKALQRAAAKIAEDARKNNYKIPVWKNGCIEYEIPGIITDQSAATDRR